MSSTCFEHDGSSSGRRLYMQLWYSVFYMQQFSSLVGERLCSILLILIHVKRKGKKGKVILLQARCGTRRG